MSANMTPSERRGAYDRANARAIAETAQILRTVAQHDSHTDPFRGDLGKAQASVLDAVGRHVATLPREIVSVIENEVGLSRRDVGSIDIADHHSLVEVPAALANDVVDVLDGGRIRGKKVEVRRDTSEA